VSRTHTDGPAAVLLDLDGTLIDTVGVWHSAYVELAAELHVLLPDDFWSSIAGRSMVDSLRVFGPAVDQHDPDALVRRLVARAAEGLDRRGTVDWSWMPGAPDLLDLLWSPTAADPARPATAVVTSAWRAFTDPLLAAALGERAGAFGAIVCGDEVPRSKPSPDPYLRAAELLGVDPQDCLVIEDSPTGVLAAESAGMVVLAVPHAGPITPAAGRAVRSDLVGLTLPDLIALHARLRSETETDGRSRRVRGPMEG